MNEATYIHLITDHTDDSLFGPEGPPDVEFNLDELLDSLHAALVKAFPAIVIEEIQVKSSNRTAIDTDGDFNDIDRIQSLINSTWETWLEQFEKDSAE